MEMDRNSCEWIVPDQNGRKIPLGDQSDWNPRGFSCFGKEKDGRPVPYKQKKRQSFDCLFGGRGGT